MHGWSGRDIVGFRKFEQISWLPWFFFVEAKMEAAGCVSLSDGWKVDPYSVHAARMSSVEVLVGVGWVGMIVKWNVEVLKT